MYCNSCGTNNPDNAVRCAKCGAALQAGAPGAAPAAGFQQPQQPMPGYPQPGYPQAGGFAQQVPNYLVWSILCIFCCWPLAIVAIVNSTKVNKMLQMGNYQGAVEASQNAKKWCWIAFICGIVIQAINVIRIVAMTSR